MEKLIKNNMPIPALMGEGIWNRWLVRLLICLALAPVFLFPPINIAKAQTLDEYLGIAAENNPELKAYFSDYLAAMERVPQVGALPDPELSIGFFLKPMVRYMGNQHADIQLMQMFPWFGTLGTRKDEASKMAVARYEVFQEAKNQLFFQVKNTWYQMYRLEEEIRITEENLQILETYERLALIRFQSAGGRDTGSGNMLGNRSKVNMTGASTDTSMGSMGAGKKANATGASNPSVNNRPTGMGSGKSGMGDVLRVRIEIKDVESNLAYLKDSRIPLQAEFNQLLNRNINEAVTITDTLPPTALSIDRVALLDSIHRNNPMLKMLEAEGKVYEARKKMARLEGRPMLGAGINYMPFSSRAGDGMAMGGKDMVMPMVSVSLPIFRKKYKAMYSEADFNQQAVRERRENTANQLATQWATVLRDLDDAIRKAGLYREQAELADQTLNLLMTGYAAEGQDFEEILRVHQQLWNYQLNLIDAVVNQHTALARLEMLGGGDGLEI